MGNPNMKSCQRQKEDHSQTENLLKEVENSSLVWENSLGQGFQWYFWQKFVQGIFNTAFKPFATFDAGKWIFSFVNPCVYFKAICGCMPYHIWMHEMYHIEKSICLLEMAFLLCESFVCILKQSVVVCLITFGCMKCIIWKRPFTCLKCEETFDHRLL